MIEMEGGQRNSTMDNSRLAMDFDEKYEKKNLFLI